MSEVSIEGLRQAFLDGESRIRLNSDDIPSSHSEIIAMSWNGGLLDDQCMRLNEGLNVLVGGRGAGKSTVIESLRFAFDIDPHCEDAKRVHNNILKDVIKPGTEVSVLVHSPNLSPQFYLIRRLHGHEAEVYDQTGELLEELVPQDVLGEIEIYGQHEISELTRQPTEIAEILKRFISVESDGDDELVEDLDDLGSSILEEITKLERLENSLAALPELREKLKRYKALGLDKKLESKSLIDEEAGIFDRLDEEIESLQERAERLCPDDLYEGILPEDYEEKYPHIDVLEGLDSLQDRLIAASERTQKYLEAVSKQVSAAAKDIKNDWSKDKKTVDDDYTKILKELSKEGIDGAAYISVSDQISKIQPKEKQKATAENELENLAKKRKKLLTKLQKQHAEEFRRLERAAKKVTKRLKGRVRVEVKITDDLVSLEDILRDHVTGQISQAIGKLKELDTIDFIKLATAIREGSDCLQETFDFSTASAKNVANGGEELALAIEQYHLPPEAILSLNVGEDGKENWKSIEQLSTGQKATAVLLLLLLEADGPLIIDQPEDDLDNRFIVGSVVSAIRAEKVGRQFIFASHNANIPVLGNAEQIVGLAPVVEDGYELVRISEDLCGSIDDPAVKDLVKELLEGGQTAFEFRREKYGF